MRGDVKFNATETNGIFSTIYIYYTILHII